MVLLYPEWERPATAHGIRYRAGRPPRKGRWTRYRVATRYHRHSRLSLDHPCGLTFADTRFSVPSVALLSQVAPGDGRCGVATFSALSRRLVARDIPVVAQLELPKGLRAFTALTQLPILDSSATFWLSRPKTLDRLVDAPVYAARYARQLDLISSSHVPVNLDLLADEPADLDVSPTNLGELQALVAQGSKVFGSPPFRHYDVLVSLSD